MTSYDGAPARGGHTVKYYDDDAEFVSYVGGFLLDGLTNDEAVAVIATRPHLDALESALEGWGQPVSGAEDRYLPVAAHDLLGTFEDRGHIQAERFVEVVDPLLDQAQEAGRRVRVFGEVVCLLWDRDEISAVLHLESLWNQLRETRDVELLCGYPSRAMADRRSLSPGGEVCRAHHHVIGPASYAGHDSPSGTVTRPRTEGRDPARRFFLPVPLAALAARRFVKTMLGEPQGGDEVEAAVTVVSEMVNNAILHAASPFEVLVSQSPDVLRVEVTDGSRSAPTRRSAGGIETDGRGLTIIDGLSSRWGFDRVADGKTVWAELDRSMPTSD